MKAPPFLTTAALGLLQLFLPATSSYELFYTRQEKVGKLYKIDTNSETPNETEVGENGINFQGLEMSPDGTLYGISDTSDGPTTLYSIDPDTAAATYIGVPSFPTTSSESPEHLVVGIHGDILVIKDNVLYNLDATNATPTPLFNITPTIGVIEGASVAPVDGNFSDTPYTAGSIFAVGNFMAYIISPDNGTVLAGVDLANVTPPSFPPNNASDETITFCGDGTFFAHTGAVFLEIDLETLSNVSQADTSRNVVGSACSLFTCPSNILASTDEGICQAQVNYATPYWINNNAAIAKTAGLASGSLFPLGTTINTFTATTQSGNEYECSFSVTVVDDEPPVYECPAETTVVNDPGQCQASEIYKFLNFTEPVDNCGNITFFDQIAGIRLDSPFPVGITKNTIRVTDSSGNTKECNYTVIVEDAEDPIANCPADISLENDAGKCEATVYGELTDDEGVDLSDNCPQFVDIESPEPNSLYPVGTTINTIRVTDSSGNTKECNFSVTVSDTTPPSIVCPADIAVDNDEGICGAMVEYDLPEIDDNCNDSLVEQIGGLPSNSTFPVGNNTNTFRVTDASGNTKECNFSVLVVDTEAPLFECPADFAVDNNEGVCGAAIYEEFALSTSEPVDNCDGPVPLELVTGIPLNSTFPVGTTTNTIRLADSAGNTKDCSFNVTVSDVEDPPLECPADITVNNDEGLCQATVSYELLDVDDNCPPTSIDLLEGLLSGAAFPVGTTTNTFRMTDPSGNTKNCSFTVTVVDVESPVTSCVDHPIVSTDPDQCGAEVYFDAIPVTDNCEDIRDLTFEQIGGRGDGGTFPLGTTTQTWKVADSSGNEATCAYNVTVVDAEPLNVSQFSCGTTNASSNLDLEQALVMPVDYLPTYTKKNGCNVSLSISNSSCHFCNDAGEAVDAFPDNIFSEAEDDEGGGTCNVAIVSDDNDDTTTTTSPTSSIQIGENDIDGHHTVTWSNTVCDSNGCETFTCGVCVTLVNDDDDCEESSGKGKGGKGGSMSKSRRLKTSSSGKGSSSGGGCMGGKGKGGKGGSGSMGMARRLRRLEQSTAASFECPVDWDPKVDELQCGV